MDVQIDSGITRGMSVVDKLGVVEDARNRAVWSEVRERGRKQKVIWEMDIPGWKQVPAAGARLRRQVIFDTDPSPDDAVAFLAAIASPDELEVLAITTVAGNVPVELTRKTPAKPWSWPTGLTSPSSPGPPLRWCGP